MEGSREKSDRGCQQCYECSRIAEELWMLAYQRVLPLVDACVRENGSERLSLSAHLKLTATEGA